MSDAQRREKGVAVLSDRVIRLAEIAGPALRGLPRDAARSMAETRCLRVLNAAQAFEEEHPGALPEPADLGLPAEATIAQGPRRVTSR